jgi:predicted dehydrogenase
MVRKQINRRQFIGGTAAAVAGFTIVPRYVLGGPGNKPPSEKLNIAAVGVGGMGKTNVQACEGENIVALCDVDSEYAGEVFKKYPNAKVYSDFRKMLEKQKDIEAVIIATPDHTHAVIAMMAMKMGKHVYVQKPLTYSVYEARKLTETAREMKVITQMGNQGHSGEGIRLVCEWMQDGAIGPVREAHAWTNRPVWPSGVQLDRPKETVPVPSTLDWDLWLGPAPVRPYHPAYHPFNWRGWWDFGTGSLGDMACHIIDPIFLALKLRYPTSVEACTSTYYSKMWQEDVKREAFPNASIIRYTFPEREGLPAVKLSWYDGGMMPARPDELEEGRRMGDDEGGVLFVGDKGKLMGGCYGREPRLIPESRMQQYTRPAASIPRITDGIDGHERDWVRACKGGAPACSNFDYAGPLTETVVMGNLAIRYPGKLLKWDGAAMKVTNMPEANDYVHRQYREGWTL